MSYKGSDCTWEDQGIKVGGKGCASDPEGSVGGRGQSMAVLSGLILRRCHVGMGSPYPPRLLPE